MAAGGSAQAAGAVGNDAGRSAGLCRVSSSVLFRCVGGVQAHGTGDGPRVVVGVVARFQVAAQAKVAACQSRRVIHVPGRVGQPVAGFRRPQCSPLARHVRGLALDSGGPAPLWLVVDGRVRGALPAPVRWMQSRSWIISGGWSPTGIPRVLPRGKGFSGSGWPLRTFTGIRLVAHLKVGDRNVPLTHEGAGRASLGTPAHRWASLPRWLEQQVAGAGTGTAIRSVLLGSKHFVPSGLIARLYTFSRSTVRVILDVLSGFFLCFQPRNLEGPSPPRTVDLGSSPALPGMFHQGISARPLSDAEPGSSNAPPAAGSMRCTTLLSRSPLPRRWQTGTETKP